MMKTSASIECLIYQTVFSDSKFIGIKGYKARSKIATIEDRNISSSMYVVENFEFILSMNYWFKCNERLYIRQ